MTSNFYFSATSWFPGNVRVKPHSKHSAPPPLEGTIVNILLSWVIKGWRNRFGSVAYGRLFQELRCPRRWWKCKQTAKNNTFYRFRWHHPLITQLTFYIMPTLCSHDHAMTLCWPPTYLSLLVHVIFEWPQCKYTPMCHWVKRQRLCQ